MRRFILLFIVTFLNINLVAWQNFEQEKIKVTVTVTEVQFVNSHLKPTHTYNFSTSQTEIKLK